MPFQLNNENDDNHNVDTMPTIRNVASLPSALSSNEGVVKMFAATPGSSGRLVVSDGPLTCTAHYVVDAASRDPSATFALYAYSGNFRHELVEQVCAITRCTVGRRYCIGWTTRSHTSFASLNISGSFSAPGLRLPLLAVDRAQLVSNRMLTTTLDTAALTAPLDNLLNFALFHYPYA
jgi:hypothetical protein